MHNTIKNTICICLISALLLCAMPTFAYTPTQRFSFAPIAYEGEIMDALPCSEGVFAVKNESFQSGFISAEGKLVIPFSFANAGSFQAGLAPAAVAGGKYGYIGRDGLFEIAPAFDSADNFSSGLARVEKDTKTFYIDRTGKAPGRGAYICDVPECFKKARKSKALERALNAKIDEAVYDQLEAQLKSAEPEG